MWTSRMAPVLMAIWILLSMGCQVTMAELQARNPAAKTLNVHCRPWQIPENVKIFSARVSGDGLTTDETPDKLWEDAEHAGVFFEVNASAPRENAKIMASEYGLVCREYLEVQSTPLEALREKKPCSTQASTARNPQLVGITNRQPCDAGAGNSTNASGSAPAPLPRIGVCARPRGITSDEWHGGPGIKADAKTRDEYDAQVAKATVIFYFDPKAPPESIWNYGPNTKVRCPGKAPIPYDQWVAKHSGAGTQQSSSANAGTGTSSPATSPATPPPPTTTPKTGSSPPSSTSSPNGQGPALSVFERIANNLAVGGALAQGDTSGNLKDPNGHRNGIPGGQNVGGFSFPLLQAGVATFQVINAVGLKPKDFIDIVNQASKKGQRGLIEKADKAALDLADDLIKNHSQYEMAKGLEEMQTIMPYEMASKFTKDLGNKFQAHKIFEKQALKRLKDSDAGFEKLPAIVLTEAEHKHVTKLLNDEWNKLPKEGRVTADQLRAIYKEAYRAYPHWLEIIEKQLRKLQ